MGRVSGARLDRAYQPKKRELRGNVPQCYNDEKSDDEKGESHDDTFKAFWMVIHSLGEMRSSFCNRAACSA